jgi:hypothetical protein|tara:strand:+ start:1846 stop:2193 length:348 start_codon:yes stop_codon:yes gene_type:complete
MRKLTSYSTVEQINALMRLLAVVMILVVMFKPVFTFILDSLDDGQKINLSENFENDSEEDDSEEENEKDDKVEHVIILKILSEPMFILKSSIITFYTMHWSEHNFGIITPPPKLS